MSNTIAKRQNGFGITESSFSSLKNYNSALSAVSAFIGQPILEDRSFVVSYLDLYNYRNEGKQSSIIAELFFSLSIPEYTSLRFEIVHAGKFNQRSFRIGLKIFNRKQKEVILKPVLGPFFEDENKNEYFLSPPTAEFLSAWSEFMIETKKTEFTKDMKFRLMVYEKLVSAYDKLEIQGKSLLDTFKVRVIEDLQYNLVGNDDGTLDVIPAFENDLGAYNNTINRMLESSSGYSSNFELRNTKQQKLYKVLLSDAATEKWKAFSDLKKLDPVSRSKELKSGAFITSFPPKQVLGKIFSERVAGFILDSPEKQIRDNKASESWSEGFDDVSNLLKSLSGSAYAIPLSPTPEVYGEIKAGIEKALSLESEQVVSTNDSEGELNTSSSLSPVSVYIPSLKDEFTLAELETLAERIEKHNKPELLDADAAFANAVISEAEKMGEHTVAWQALDGEQVRIPIASLKSALKEISAKDIATKSVGVKLTENVDDLNSGESGLSDDWYLHDNIEQFATATSFRAGVRLRPHQVRGYAWLHGLATKEQLKELCRSRGALLADDMGLGKTIQVIRLIESFRNQFKQANKPILIVGPVSLLNTSWEADGINAFFNDDFLANNKVIHLKDVRKVVPRALVMKEVLSFQNAIDSGDTEEFESLELSGEIQHYLEIFRQTISNSIVLCSYETLRSRIFELAAVDFSLVVLDEAQKIKNASTGQSRAAKALKADMKVAMTGTPIENSITDLWSICDFAVKDHLGSLKSFKERYLVRIATANPGSPERKAIADELERHLKPIWLRRTKKEVLKNGEIPPVIHFDSCLDNDGKLVNKHLVQMSDSQYEIFQTQAGYFNECRSGHKLAAIRNMLEACYAPWWAKGVKADITNIEKMFELSPKLRMTFDILTEIATKDEKVIIFVNIIELQHQLAKLIPQWCAKTFKKLVDCEFFNGDFSLEERSAMLARFKKAHGFKALIISPRSGGAGLNIVEANHVIHYTREWNPAVERQATDRVHRLGQTKDVYVYYPTSSLSERDMVSAEEHLANILRAKREVIDDFTISESDLGSAESQFGSFHFSTKDTVLTPEGIVTLGPYRFEKLVCLYYQNLGFRIEHVGGAGDNGCDLLAFSSDKNLIVQVKFTEVSQPQGTAGINQARAAKSYYESVHKCNFELAVVTNAIFSPNAHSLAIVGDIVELVEGNALYTFVTHSKIYVEELKA